MWVLVARLVAITGTAIVATLVVQANLRPHEPQVLGHVLDTWPHGFWVFGVEYGWPLIFCTKGSGSDAFDDFSPGALAENTMVGLALAAIAPVAGEFLIWYCRRFRSNPNKPISSSGCIT